MKKFWKQIQTRMVFDYPYMKVRQDTVELPNGKILDDYYLWIEGDIVLVVPITKDDKFVLVSQYKHGTSQIMLEFPAGYVDENENITKAAVRELEEETGYTSASLELLGTLTNNPTKIVGRVHVFLAKDAALTKPQQLDTNEDIDVILLDKHELKTAIASGKIWVSGTIAAAFLAFMK